MNDATVLRAEKTQFVETKWGSLRWVASRELGNAENITVGRVVIKKGQANPSHSHGNCEEALYLLRGRLDHFYGDQHVIVEPGDTFVVGPGIAHHALSIGDEDAEMIVVYSTGARQFKAEP